MLFVKNKYKMINYEHIDHNNLSNELRWRNVK